MLVAAGDQVSAARAQGQYEHLTAELDAVVERAKVLGAFVGYESLLARLTHRGAATSSAPTMVEMTAQVQRHLVGMSFETDLDASIAELGHAATEAEAAEDDEDHQFSTAALVAMPFMPGLGILDGDRQDATESARRSAIELRGEIQTIRSRVRSLHAEAAALALRFAHAHVPDAAKLAAGSVQPSIDAQRARFMLLGGLVEAKRMAALTRSRASDQDHTIGMTLLGQVPGLLGVPYGLSGVKLEAGTAAGVIYGAGAAIRDTFAGALDMMKLAAGASEDVFATGGIATTLQVASKLQELFEHAPELPSLVGEDLAHEWTEASAFGKGELIGKIVGYLAMSIALVAASGAESLELELAANGSKLAGYALRLLRLTDAAANPLTLLKPFAKLAKLPQAAVDWLRSGSRARQALEEEQAAQRLAAEAARAAAGAWSETAEGSRVLAALVRGNETAEILVGLTDVQRARLPAIHALIANGRVKDAITEIDLLVSGGLDRAAATKIEDALAVAEGKTRPSVYRSPVATIPGVDKPVKSTGNGARLHYGTDTLQPERVFAEGLLARGSNLDLLNHVRQGGESAFRGTTSAIVDKEQTAGAGLWAGEGGWVYEIDDVQYWDVNVLLEGRVRQPDGSFGGNPAFGEHEKAILANVPRERIRGAYPMIRVNGKLRPGPMVLNPHYKAMI